MMLEAVVPDDINRRTTEFVDRNPENEPIELMDEAWFVDHVIKNPQAAGAVRALLGKGFISPMIMSNHRVECPRATSGGWQRDSGAVDSPRLDSLFVFYYPQDTPADLRPTEILPGSHLLRIKRRYMTQYGSIRQAVQTAAPAGYINRFEVPCRITSRFNEVFLEQSGRKIWERGEPSREPYIPCYRPRRLKGGERSVAQSVA